MEKLRHKTEINSEALGFVGDRKIKKKFPSN